jgi:NTE family protein
MKILVMSGGGAKGSYSKGCLRYLLGDLEINYQGFCGISVGALNSAFLAQFCNGQEKQSYEELDKLWKRINTSKIHKRWFPFGKLHGLWKSSLYNSEPLLNWVNSELDVEKIKISNKIVSVGAVSLTAGKYKLFDQNNPNFVKAVCASSSYPGFLIPIEIDGELYTDGGVHHIAPLQAAIELGADEIDILLTSPVIDSNAFPSNPNAINVITRTLDLMTDQIIANDIAGVEYYNNLIVKGFATDKRFIKFNLIRPNKDLTSDSLDFTPALLDAMAATGYEDAKLQYKP